MSPEVLKKKVSQIKACAAKLWKSRDLDYSKEIVKTRKGRHILIEVTRFFIDDEDEDPFIYEDDDEVIDYSEVADCSPEPGTPMSMTLYAVINNQEVDACTVQYPELENVEADAEYLLKCYG